MDVEQTTQLIQLILNSVLMVNACGLILAGLLPRQATVNDRAQTASREYSASLDTSPILRNDRQLQLKKQLRQLQQRQRMVSNSVLSINYALLLFVISTLLLALRTTLDLPWLIPGSLSMFSIGVGALLLGLVLTLFDLHLSDRSIWQEIKELLSVGRASNEPRGVRVPRNRAKDAAHPTALTRSQLRPKAKVG